MAVDVRTYPKEMQYNWSLSLLNGKMVSDATCIEFSKRCPDLRTIGIICPTFGDQDIEPIVALYMQKYPEHRGYEQRLAWLIQCIFTRRLPATPPGVTRLAPYVPKDTTQTFIAPGTRVLQPGQPSPESPPQAAIPGLLKIAGVGLLVYMVLIKS